MAESENKRREMRLRYSWPVWYGHDYNDSIEQGQMVDLNSEAAAFSCYADQCPGQGEHITARFSVPDEASGSFAVDSLIRTGYVCRVEHTSDYLRKVALRFFEPLDFLPASRYKSAKVDQ